MGGEASMDKRNKKEELENYYELKATAVNELAEVLKQEPEKTLTPKQERRHPNPYKIDRLSRIPTWIKAFFIKFWMAGAICYFGFWGLGYYFASTLDLVVMVGLITGIVTDLLLNPSFLYFESDRKEYHKYMMLPVSGKRIWTLLINVAYGVMATVTVFVIYTLINMTIVSIKNLPVGTVSLSVEPLLYGLFFLMVDMFFISFKNLIVGIVKSY
jgi:hypothetical protein